MPTLTMGMFSCYSPTELCRRVKMLSGKGAVSQLPKWSQLNTEADECFLLRAILRITIYSKRKDKCKKCEGLPGMSVLTRCVPKVCQYCYQSA